MIPGIGALAPLVVAGLTAMSAMSATGVAAAGAPAPPPTALTFGRFGTVPVVAPAGPPTQVVLFLTGGPAEPAQPGVTATAGTLAAWGAAVLVVDSSHYLAAAEKGRAKCTYPAADFESLAHFAEQRLGLPRYIPPLLVGDAGGAALAYATLAQAPPFTFQGAVTAGFCPEIAAVRPFCPGNDLHAESAPGGAGQRLAPATELEVPWIVLDGPGPACPAAAGGARDFVAKVPTARVLSPPAGAAQKAGEALDPVLLRQAFDVFADAGGQEAARVAGFGDVRDLPLIEVPAARKELVGAAAPPGPPEDTFTLILSGDGGWVGLDRRVGRHLADIGMPVVGWNTLKYFWTPRDPDEAARDLARVLTHYFKEWGKRRVILVGYSQGADVLPFLASRLPAELREKVAFLALLGSDGLATFDFDFGGWMAERPKRPDLPVLPEIARLNGMRLLCVYAAGETDSPCRTLPPGATAADARAVELPGGHAFGRDVTAITGLLLREIESAPRSPR